MAKTLVSVKDGPLWVVKYTYIVWIIYHTQVSMKYCGRYWDELQASKKAIEIREKSVDQPKKIT